MKKGLMVSLAILLMAFMLIGAGCQKGGSYEGEGGEGTATEGEVPAEGAAQ